MKFCKTAVRIISAAMAAVMCFTLLSLGVCALSLETRGSIILTTVDKESETPISNVVFRVYHVADAFRKGDGVGYEYTEHYKYNGMDMGNFSDAYLPVHLTAYSHLNDLPYIEKETDTDGTVVFDGLVCGAYLVVPEDIDSEYINPSPFIVVIPMRNTTHNTWIYHIDATPKIVRGIVDAEKKAYISVEKQWENTDKIPESIEVSLLKDGTVTETVTLNAANGWYYKWENLDNRHSWCVIETEVPDGYRVSYEVSQMTVIITNTGIGEPTTTPGDTTEPEDTTKPDELIQTGQLNWPVPILSIAGLLLFSIGWAILNFSKKEEEEAV